MALINVYGISSTPDGFPQFEPLLVGESNDSQENPIEIARQQWLRARREWGRDYAGVVLTQGEDCRVFDFATQEFP